MTITNYDSIKADNKHRYGTDIARYGSVLLADRYEDRTHFIFELLQNAEDALARRGEWHGPREVTINLTRNLLRVSHHGQPFNEADVRGICGIAESTKNLTAIGKFGIGFKSVYAITDRPEVHSGAEAFAIENFVWPVGVERVQKLDDETLFILPFRPDDSEIPDDVVRGLHRLGATTLLFLRNIEEVHWTVDGGHSGTYIRHSEILTPWVRRVSVIGKDHETGDVDEEWLIFSRAIATDRAQHAGHVELAFSLLSDKARVRRIRRIERSPLVVFFPTAVDTYLGFLIQGPYRTTPSRDNIPRNDHWNRRLIDETGTLLLESLRWLRDNGLLDITALTCLPIDRSKFGEASMFAPLFQLTKSAMSTERLLPRLDHGYVCATEARLGRTQELRELFNPSQLAALLAETKEMHWLSGDISQDRSPELRRYLIQELEIAEITPEVVIPRLSKAFLEAQPDPWIAALYEFLNGQPALRRRGFVDLPIVRLEDGTHVPTHRDGQPQAFLPTTIVTGFPTVRRSVCTSDTAREFLRSLGLTEPDPVDDVVRNVLSKYSGNEIRVEHSQYEADILRILNAFHTDSKTRRERLLAELRDSTFVKTVDASDGSKSSSKPGDAYLATTRLKELFAGVKGIRLVDDECQCLLGEDVRDLLEACGTVRYFRPIPDRTISHEELEDLRAQAGHPDTSGYSDRITDWSILGLEHVLATLPGLDRTQQMKKAELLWEELAHLEERRGKSIFTGEYTWTHYGSYRVTFDAAFVRVLNNHEWVPDSEGNLQRPEAVVFDSLGWKSDPFLTSKLRFKSPILEELARQAGIEPGVIDLLKKHGVTSVSELVARLGISENHSEGFTVNNGMDGGEGNKRGNTPTKQGQSTRQGGGNTTKQEAGSDVGHARDFISYVAVKTEEVSSDPEGLDHQTRMEVEAKAIGRVLSREPEWQPTPTHNPGFDLYKLDEHGIVCQWCEVKGMRGSLSNRPVGLSRTQFECAREHGESYWLYVVEHADSDSARVIRIRDPFGKSRTFTFDRGWVAVAELDTE